MRVGDTLSTWTVTEKHPKPIQRAGVVVVADECRNQHGELVAEADGKMLAHERPG